MNYEFTIHNSLFSGGQPFNMPAIRLSSVAETVVETVFAGLPEFEGVWSEPVAAPVTWAGDEVVPELCHKIFVSGFQIRAIFEDGTLTGHPGGDLAPAWAGLEIGFGLGGGEFGDLSGDADLAVLGEPVKYQGGVRVLGEFAAFLAFVVGEEGEAQYVVIFEEDHARGGDAVRGGGGEGHGVGLEARLFSGAEPRGELGEGVGVEVGAVHPERRK